MKFPLSYLGYTSNGHLFQSTFCAGGGNVTFVVCVQLAPNSDVRTAF